MASVWAGTNESTGKLVALKVIRSTFMATPGADAFLRSEGLVASRVNHPNVVTVFDVVEQDGMACIVMELLDGLPLATYIARQGPLSLPDTVGLLLPAMRGVAAAHAQGVVHRDLKPQNIFVCIGPDARIVTTKVLDFGISLMVDWARGSSVAAIPGPVGTPSYMAPEHIEGSTVLDPRTDVYGFGLLFYEALSGRMAFPGEPGPELLHQVLTQSPIPLRELRPDLPMGFTAVIETAMAKRPEQRWGGLNEMVHALEEQGALAGPLLAGTPAAGVPTTAMSYAVSSSIAIAVPSHIGKEPSGAILKTQMFGQPTGREEDLEGGRPDLAGSGNPGTPARVVVEVGALTELDEPSAGWLLTRLRQRRVQVGAGMVALTLIIIVGVATSRRGVSGPAATPGSRVSAPSSLPIAAPALPAPVVAPIPQVAEAASVPVPKVSPTLPPPPLPREPPHRPPRLGAPKSKSVAPAPHATERSGSRAGSLREADF